MICFFFLTQNVEINEITQGNISKIIYFYIDFSEKKKYMDVLLDNPNININSQTPETFLVYSILHGDVQMVNYLIDRGADVNLTSYSKFSNPLYWSIYQNQVEIVDVLAESPEIDVDQKNSLLETPLHALFYRDNDISDTTKIKLLSKTTNINSADRNGVTILHYIAKDWKKYQDILINHILKIYYMSKHSTRPIDFVTETEKKDFFELVYQTYIKQISRVDPERLLNNSDKNISSFIKNNKKIPDKLRDEIMDKIINHKVSYPKLKPINHIVISVAPETNINIFLGITEIYLTSLLYLLKKYPNLKIPSLKKNNSNNSQKIFDALQEKYQESQIILDFLLMINDYDIIDFFAHYIKWVSHDEYYISQDMENAINHTIMKYPNTTHIIFMLTIHDKESHVDHMNIILFNIKNNTMERYDPYGSCDGSQRYIDMDNTLEKIFYDTKRKIKYLSMPDIYKHLWTTSYI